MDLAADLVYEIKTVADPALAPDGARLVYVLSWVEGRGGAAENRSRLMLAEPPGRPPREFTQGVADSSPRFSPDGGMLALLRAEKPGQPRQVWTMPADGGEARQLTAAPKGVADFAWAPGGDRIVYCADTDPPGDANDTDGGPRVAVISRIRYRHDQQGWRGDAHYHLYVIGWDGGAAIQLTDGDWDDFAPVWSPDGTKIAFISGRCDDRDFRARNEVYVVDAAGGPAQCVSDGLCSAGAAAWAPDSQRLAALGTDDPAAMELWQGWLYILAPGRPPRRITNDAQRPVLAGSPGAPRQPEIRWADDGRIIFLGERRGASYIYEAAVDGDASGEARPLWGGGGLAAGLSLDAAGRRAAVALSTPESPSQLRLIDLDHPDTPDVYDPNAAFYAKHPGPAPRLEKFVIHRHGFDIESRLWFPPDFDPARRYPLVLDIHGGPNGAFYDAFVPWQQLLARAGYLTLAVNPRGSSTYGGDFMRAVLDDWGGEDYLDLMAAVDAVCQRDYVDAARLGVHGYSYGGYMAAWAIGHTGRFGAAVIGAPCINLYTMYGTSDIGISFGEPQWGGTVMDTPEKLLSRSPISHAKAVTTPALLLHGEADARCPIAQSEEYYTALKRLGKTVEFVRFPASNHQFPRTGHPRLRQEYLARMAAWFGRWLG